MLSKLVTHEQAVEHVQDGTRLMYGGFGTIGSPAQLIDAILHKGVQSLTLIGIDAGYPEIGIGKLISHGRVRRLITTHIGSNPEAGQQLMDGMLEVTFCPQGIFAEKIRAGGVGIPGIVVDAHVGGERMEGAEPFAFGGRSCQIEAALTAEVGIVYAKQADTYGNLIYDKAARNLNPLVAMAADITIAEVEEIVPAGELDPDKIVTPGIFVDYIVVRGGGNS
ncbi:3-oxoacid CoA-transferase subunit A [Brevibacillus formosus]|uniref:CoA transferase subunit A n=1 Tax=Brevibacillus formosus TaxID=54913 RepID=UPI001C678C55|nr:CoA transferase subunit A [Brevibacillus formosus]MBW5466391.1 3-oxoacid CoA-transferase subunit A [Brevibacillus formosus]